LCTIEAFGHWPVFSDGHAYPIQIPKFGSNVNGDRFFRRGYYPRLKMVTNNFGNRNFMQPMRRFRIHSGGLYLGGWGSKGGVPIKFPKVL
jgi:hypothetical protein